VERELGHGRLRTCLLISMTPPQGLSGILKVRRMPERCCRCGAYTGGRPPWSRMYPWDSHLVPPEAGAWNPDGRVRPRPLSAELHEAAGTSLPHARLCLRLCRPAATRAGPIPANCNHLCYASSCHPMLSFAGFHAGVCRTLLAQMPELVAIHSHRVSAQLD
jgi:hypothetical protein